MTERSNPVKKHPGLADFVSDRRGVIAILLALTLPIMIGFIGLGVEVGMWFMFKRGLQTAADAAAIGGGHEVRSGSSSAAIASTAGAEAARNGLNTGAGDTITVNYQYPASGAYVSDGNAVEVLLGKTVVLLFSNYFLSDSIKIDSRAVATLSSSANACVLALDTSSSKTLTNSGDATITLNGCSVAVNSSHSTAMSLNGSSSLSAACASIAGNYSMVGSASISTTCAGPITGARTVADPYESVTEPSTSGCDFTNYSANDETLSPGTYCKGINFSGNVILNSGLYIIDAGNFKINSGATVSSQSGGVTIFLTKQNSGPKYAYVTINGGATVDLAAQSAGTYAGLLFYQDDDNTDNQTNTINGGTSVSLTGALYFPSGDFKYTGGASSDNNSCMQIIAQTVTFSSAASMNVSCSGSGMADMPVYDTVTLVE